MYVLAFYTILDHVYIQDCSLLNKAGADLPSHGQYVGRVTFNPRSDWLKVILYKKEVCCK